MMKTHTNIYHIRIYVLNIIIICLQFTYQIQSIFIGNSKPIYFKFQSNQSILPTVQLFVCDQQAEPVTKKNEELLILYYFHKMIWQLQKQNSVLSVSKKLTLFLWVTQYNVIKFVHMIVCERLRKVRKYEEKRCNKLR